MNPSTKASFFSLAYFLQFIKFGVVGAIGIFVNEGLLIFIRSRGVYFLTAGAIAIEVSILSNFVINDLWTFRDRRSGRAAERLVKFNALMLAGLAVNLAVLYEGVGLGLTPEIANLVGIAAAFFLRYALSVRYAWMRIETIEEGNAAHAPEPLTGTVTAGS